MTPPSIRIAVLVPCFNEEAAVATVVAGFHKALPSAEIFVYDNNSTDRTIAVARAAGAQVRSERRQGKGHVVRRMFADIDADIYVLVDGDATYDAASAPRMIDALLSERLDMVVGLRVDQAEAAYRRGHRTGNRMLTSFLSSVFGQAFKDILSGYRVFSRRFVKSFPVLSDGFEIETELSVHALELALPVAEIETPYYARPEGSFSKLNTWRDGFRILGTILKLYRSEKPLRFFTVIGIFSGAGFDRPRDTHRHHLSRVRHRSSSADRGSVDGPDDFGCAVDLIRTGARYGDARPARDEAAGLFVASPHRQKLMRFEIRQGLGDGPRLRQMLSRGYP
jgi:glycosyltransferase involved in cell wall biosynthesis